MATYNPDVENVERQRIAGLAHALAEELGKTGEAWQVKPRTDDDGRTHYEIVTGPEGMALFIHGEGWAGRGRLRVSGDYPRREGTYYGPREDRANATIAAERAQGDTLARAAREIVTRMVAPYREQYALALTQARQHDDYQNKAEANAAKMRAALGDTSSRSEYRKDSRLAFYVNQSPGRTYASGTCGDDSARFEHMTTTIEKALRIAAILVEPEAAE